MKQKIRKILKLIERRTLPDKFSCNLKFRAAFGRWINWKNPKTFSEKIQWRKIYDRNPLYTKCADRFAVRGYVKKNIGEKHLIPLLFAGKPEEIDFDTLKPPFVIKTNHNVGKHYFVKTKDDYKNINKKEVVDYFSKCLKKNFYPSWREWQYKNIMPKVVIERMLLNKGNIPSDYKFHCFGGKVGMVQVDMGRFECHTRCILDRKGKVLPFSFGPFKEGKLDIKMVSNFEKPKNFDKMVRVAEKLSKDFNYIRVDLYSVSNKIYFSELTITPCAGFERFIPKKWDYHFSKSWEIKK